MNDAETKPVLFCSCNDNTVRLYDLPSGWKWVDNCLEVVVGAWRRGPLDDDKS
ncbi:hypothetical protein SCA6_013684, partial [Theobroma cacao]